VKLSKDLVAASARPLVLAILARGDGYGYAIIRDIRALSGGQLEWTEGMLYPVLHRLEQEGLIASQWDVAENGRKRKYYRLKKDGSRALAHDQEQWGIVQAVLQRLRETSACAS
jgi:DNA-binding PadR family transcriptional regulator